MSQIKVTFFSGVGTVTGSNFMIEGENFRALIDCGLEQGSPEAEKRNLVPFPYDPSRIDYLFVTHAHADHIGRIPKLIKDGFRGKIYSTPETKALAEVMIDDTAHILEMDAQESGEAPMYSKEDELKALSLWQTINYHEKLVLTSSVAVEPKDAGHILGSAMYEFSFKDEKGAEKTILFTGDLGNSPSPLLQDTEYVKDAEFIVMESVYGDRMHENREERENRLLSVLKDTIERKRTLLIPAFSLERTQTILYEMNNFIENGKLQSLPVYLDSPLAVKVTRIYEKMTNLYKSEVRKEISKGDNVFDFSNLKKTVTVSESRHIIETPNPKVIIAGSGMSTGGRILGHEEHLLPKKSTTVLFIGYQAPGTLGRQIEDGAKKILINEKKVEVNAEVVTIHGFSGHKDRDGLIDFIEKASEGKLKKVFVTMGEPKASLFLAQRLRDYIGVDAIVPEVKKEYFL